MAYLPRVQECKNGCGASIYFDRDSKVSHPSQDRWIPLEYNEDTGVYTGEKHQCPKYSNGNGLSEPHQQQQQQPQPQQQTEVTMTDLMVLVKLLNQKVDRLLAVKEVKG